MIENNCFKNCSYEKEYPFKDDGHVFFLFESENSRLFNYETSKYNPNRTHCVKASTYDAYKAYLKAHPVAVIFKGCDDGSVGLRFKTKDDAMEFLSCLTVFEDVFDYDHTRKKEISDSSNYDELTLHWHN